MCERETSPAGKNNTHPGAAHSTHRGSSGARAECKYAALVNLSSILTSGPRPLWEIAPQTFRHASTGGHLLDILRTKACVFGPPHSPLLVSAARECGLIGENHILPLALAPAAVLSIEPQASCFVGCGEQRFLCGNATSLSCFSKPSSYHAVAQVVQAKSTSNVLCTLKWFVADGSHDAKVLVIHC